MPSYTFISFEHFSTNRFASHRHSHDANRCVEHDNRTSYPESVAEPCSNKHPLYRLCLANSTLELGDKTYHSSKQVRRQEESVSLDQGVFKSSFENQG